jgi:hypothetical protein
MSGLEEAVFLRHEYTLKKFLAASISLDLVLSFNVDETAESYIFRLANLLNPIRLDIPLTDALSRAIILILLQCATRIFPEHQWSTQISKLFRCSNFRGILEIGFGAKFNKIAQQNALRKVRLEPTSAETWTQNYTAFAASRKIEANLV